LIKEPSFLAYPDKSGLNNYYKIYLTSNEGVIAFYEYFEASHLGRRIKGSWKSKEYNIKDLDHWRRIMETNHVMFMPETQNFERGISPKKAMDIGMGEIWIYDIEANDQGGYSFRTNNEEIIRWIKSVIPSISDNEIDRFLSFTMQDIYNRLPAYLLDKKAEKELTDFIKNEIRGYSGSWMGMHSDKAMGSIMRNSR